MSSSLQLPESSSSFYQDKVVVVTGGGSGIGQALCVAFAQAGACVVVVDLPGKTKGLAQQLPRNTTGTPNNKHQHPKPQPQRHLEVACDVTDPAQVAQLIDRVQRQYHGKLDIYCSNAGIMIPPSTTNIGKKGVALDDSAVKHSLKEWNKILQVNLLSHVTALRALLPLWNNNNHRSSSSQHDTVHFCVTASAAGLLTMVGDASYGVSKAAAVSFCEHVAIAHPHIRVHCLCPQAVDTPLVRTQPSPPQQSATTKTASTTTSNSTSSHSSNAAMVDGVLTPEQVADVTLRGIQRGDFFLFPHDQVPNYASRKAKNHARWLQGMRRLRNKLIRPPTTTTMSSKL